MTTALRTSPAGTLTLAAATLRRFHEGDASAFAEVVRAFTPLMRGVVARYWKGAFEREEAMQEIWLHVFRHRDALDLARGDAFAGWLAVLARRRCIDLLRHRIDLVPLDELPEAAALAWLTAPADERPVEGAELAAAVAAFAAKLQPPWRQFFALHFVEGLDYAEVGARLKIGKLRCKYMRKVLSERARRSGALMAALGRARGDGDAS
ncbi:MAG TPA: sigma-70 family RNA polymerase sigma factor [Polyangia bacterium]